MLPCKSKPVQLSFWYSIHWVTLIVRGWYQVVNESEAKFIVLLDYGVAGSISKTGSIPFMDRPAAAPQIILALTIHLTVDLEPTRDLYTMPTWG